MTIDLCICLFVLYAIKYEWVCWQYTSHMLFQAQRESCVGYAAAGRRRLWSPAGCAESTDPLTAGHTSHYPGHSVRVCLALMNHFLNFSSASSHFFFHISLNLLRFSLNSLRTIAGHVWRDGLKLADETYFLSQHNRAQQQGDRRKIPFIFFRKKLIFRCFTQSL